MILDLAKVERFNPKGFLHGMQWLKREEALLPIAEWTWTDNPKEAYIFLHHLDAEKQAANMPYKVEGVERALIPHAVVIDEKEGIEVIEQGRLSLPSEYVYEQTSKRYPT